MNKESNPNQENIKMMLKNQAISLAAKTMNEDSHGRTLPHTADSLIDASEKIYKYLTKED